MNIQQLVIEAFSRHAPKYAGEFRQMVYASESHDVIVLANLVTILSAERCINTVDMPNPFPPDSNERADWAAWFNPEIDIADKKDELGKRRREETAAKVEPEPEAEEEQSAEIETLKARIAELEAENLAAVDDPVVDSETGARINTAEAQPGTPETDADPQNPNVAPAGDPATETVETEAAEAESTTESGEASEDAAEEETAEDEQPST